MAEKKSKEERALFRTGEKPGHSKGTSENSCRYAPDKMNEPLMIKTSEHKHKKVNRSSIDRCFTIPHESSSSSSSFFKQIYCSTIFY